MGLTRIRTHRFTLDLNHVAKVDVSVEVEVISNEVNCVEERMVGDDSVSKEVEATISVGLAVGVDFSDCETLVKKSIDEEGIGGDEKVPWVRELRCLLGVDFLAIQESKAEDLSKFDFSMLWGNRSFGVDYVGSVGQSGGLICMWDSSILEFNVTVKNMHFLRLSGVFKGSGVRINIINVYAPQGVAAKNELWGLIEGEFRKLSKIDRVLVCPGFFNKWPLACLRVLPSRFSDHCPLFLSSKLSGFGARPFRVFNSWLMMDGYEEVVKEAVADFEFEGPPDTKLSKKFAFLRGRIKAWKVELDAKLYLEENSALAEIGNLEEVMGERNLNEEEEWIYVESKKVLKVAGVRKALDVKQRSRVRWAIDGDENLSFFHGVAREVGLFNGIALPRGGPSISHLFYADDAIILGEWDHDGIINVVRVLRCFHICSGLKINISKSNMFGIGVNLAEVEEEAISLGCKASTVPFKYLGLVVGANMNRVCNWKPVYDVFEARLSKWKASCLSIGGRMVLINSMLESLPCYYFSIYRAPCKVINVLKLNVSNTALLSKWGWRFKAEKNSLWSKVIKALHNTGRCWDFIPSNKALAGVWNNIVKVLSRTVISNMPIRRFFKGLVGDGESVAFWLDPWVCNEHLKDLCPNLFRLEKDKKCRVKSRMGLGELWSWSSTRASVYEMAELDFLVYVVDSVDLNGRRDKWNWLGDKSGNFSVSSVRRLMYSESDYSNNYVLRWCNWLPAKCNVFIWQAEMSKIPTSDALRRRNMVGVEGLCSICGEDLESVEHLFTTCWVAMLVWNHICNWTRVQHFFAFSFRALIEVHEHVGLKGKAKKVFQGIIFLSCWVIWRARNKLKFEGKKSED
ncbi:RNA-directed DNA polymerase, eukaryota [Artemisia annua]|uniref:RNA-directed DNA polymerase, eukaryota n=1 Tax=Artemisia annua TaxID=35608 RepID=A0A2U1NCG5_ARTAN|nr:RNA-directed DNA polymerase, eukaryota [Artemisia annua]